MRVLIDTNILISALLRDGLPESVILWVLNNPEWGWLVSPAIMDEYRDVLQRKKLKLTAPNLRKFQNARIRRTRKPQQGL